MTGGLQMAVMIFCIQKMTSRSKEYFRSVTAEAFGPQVVLGFLDPIVDQSI